jgi:hypothetical protein
MQVHKQNATGYAECHWTPCKCGWFRTKEDVIKRLLTEAMSFADTITEASSKLKGKLYEIHTLMFEEVKDE